MARRRALITGITGQDGSLLAERLVAEGTEVVGLVRSPGSVDHPDLAAIEGAWKAVHGDLGDPASLRRAVLDVRPDELYHLAAPTFVPASWDDPVGTLSAIAGATATVLAAVREAGGDTRVFVATSSEIFGDCGVVPQTEAAPTAPRSPYGVAKLAAHHLVRLARERDGLHASAGITFNHESPRRPERFVTRRITRGVAEIATGRAKTLRLGDLSAVRDWCDARDVVRGAVLAVRHDEPGEYVLASGVGRTVRDFLDAAFAHAGLDPDGRVEIDASLVRAPETTPSIGDPARALAVLGWRAEIPFADLVGAMVDADRAALGA